MGQVDRGADPGVGTLAGTSHLGGTPHQPGNGRRHGSLYVLSDYAPVSAVDAAPKARPAAQRALAIDDTLAEAHAVLAGAEQTLWEWDAAEREFRHALELEPNNGAVHQWYGLFLSSLGRHEQAHAQFRRALELDPLNLTFNNNA